MISQTYITLSNEYVTIPVIISVAILLNNMRNKNFVAIFTTLLSPCIK